VWGFFLGALLTGAYTVLVLGIGYHTGRKSRWEETFGLPPTPTIGMPSIGNHEEVAGEYPTRETERSLMMD